MVEPIAWTAGAGPDRRGHRQLALRGARRAGAATISSTAPTGSGWPGTSPTCTPGRWTSPATSSRATGSRSCFERLVSEDGEIRFGRVLAGDLHDVRQEPHGVPLRAGRPAPPSTTPPAIRSAAPSSGRRCEFRRISSTFARARFHPILGITRRHEGTDYAAAPGTPVMAAGDGVVLRAGRAGGYGNLIELRHRNGITTRYGHLRGFARGIHAGARVDAGRRRSATSARPVSPAGRTCTTSSGSTASPRTRAGSSSATARPIRDASARFQRASATACCSLLHPARRQRAGRGRRRARIAQQSAETQARWLP